ncbi:MAG: S9 family peptidase [Sphingomonadales bacterium]|nr:S9 family peptidase [Sphingomonadales bacterium]
MNRIGLAAALLAAAWAGIGMAAEPAGPPKPPEPAAAPSAIPARIPTEVLARQPFISGPKVSPDGHRVAALVSKQGKQMLAVIELTSGHVALQTLPDDFDLRWYRWAGNDTLLTSFGRTVPWFEDEAYRTNLLAFDVATNTPYFLGAKEQGLTGDDVLWIDPEGKRLLLSYQPTIYDFPAVYSVDIATNKRTLVTREMTDIWDWYADGQGVVRYGLGWSLGKLSMVYRTKDGEKFHSVVNAKADEDNTWLDVAKFFNDSDEGYALVRGDDTEGRFGLYRYNFATRKRGDKVFDQPAIDIDDFDIAADGKSLLAAWYTDDRNRVKWFDPQLAGIQADLDKAVGDRVAWIGSRSRANTLMLVHIGGSDRPGDLFTYQPGEGVLHLLAHMNEAMPKGALVKTRYVHYKARDGLDIPAYLTLPAGRDPRKLPLVIMPHGGPFDVRDDGGYDPEVQFLANRGYVVLQPQFRGSGGYGKPWSDKGEGQWGRAMQDDLDDGMDWLAKDGIVDPKRACIVGSSYGGYAAEWGAVRNPERYRCAASFAGVSDVNRWFKYVSGRIESKRYRNDWQRQVKAGDDKFDLKTVSPLYTVDRLKVPLLLAHGDKDQRVPFKQTQLFTNALKAAGKTYEFYPIAGEGHGFSTEANRKLWLDRLDAFLARYNPAD